VIAHDHEDGTGRSLDHSFCGAPNQQLDYAGVVAISDYNEVDIVPARHLDNLVKRISDAHESFHFNASVQQLVFEHPHIFFGLLFGSINLRLDLT
jgi:hypothetical protein